MSTAVNAGTYLHHMQLGTPNPEALARFYADALDMVARPLDDADWICEGPQRRLLFTPGEAKALGYAAFACRDAEGLAAMRARVMGKGVAIEPSPSPLFGPEAFAVRDSDGHLVAFGLATGDAPRRGLRGPLQHLTLATRDPKAIETFYVDVLGFLPSDYVATAEGVINTIFTRSNHEHHTLACFRQDRVGIDHHSYEAGDWAEMKSWCDRMGELHIPIMWGPGRHGPWNNLFIFIEDPDKNWIEISAELEVVHDRPVATWPHEPRTLNLWGRAIMRA
jgi:catechol 2,3-dioxygenase-like lactoylglutathione lyase family enzyme